MKKIGELNALAGTFVIYYDETDHNHYKLYKKWFNKGWHRKLIKKYADLASCTWWIHDYINQYNEEGR